MPRWRDFDTTVALGELSSNKEHPPTPAFNTNALTEFRYEEWRLAKTIWHASDVLCSAFSAGNEDSYRDVATFIIENQGNAPAGLVNLARRVLSPNLITFPPVHADRVSVLQSEIHSKRKRLAEEPRNAIVWADLARLYTLIGLTDKATISMRTALALAPFNRFILRSAGRLFLHTQDTRSVLHIFRAHSAEVLRDPWLTAAEISIASAAESPSAFAKKGLAIASDDQFSHFSRTELQAALATLEMKHGRNRDARRLFKHSLVSPNENSLAQVEWAERFVDGLTVSKQQLQIPRSYEARAYDAFHNEMWDEALHNGLDWIDDEPYSSRPYIFASYIDSSILERYKLSIQILNNALSTNADNPAILNNLAFALANLGQLQEAANVLNRAKAQSVTEEQAITLLATGGLILMRSGQVAEGRKGYKEAYTLAKKVKNNKYRQLAAIYLAREEFLAKTTEARSALDAATSDVGPNPEPDVRLLFDRLIEMFHNEKIKRTV